MNLNRGDIVINYYDTEVLVLDPNISKDMFLGRVLKPGKGVYNVGEESTWFKKHFEFKERLLDRIEVFTPNHKTVAVGSKDILKIEVQEVFNKYAIKIIYQKNSHIPIEAFSDNKLGVISSDVSSYDEENDILYISESSEIFLVSSKHIESIKNRIILINEKYKNITDTSRRVLKGHCYFYISEDMKVHSEIEQFSMNDFIRFEAKNYFHTYKETEEKINDIKKILNK